MMVDPSNLIRDLDYQKVSCVSRPDCDDLSNDEDAVWPRGVDENCFSRSSPHSCLRLAHAILMLEEHARAQRAWTNDFCLLCSTKTLSTSSNVHLACLSTSALRGNMDHWQLEVWKLAAPALMCMPSIALFLWLILSLALPLVSGSGLRSLGGILPDAQLREEVDLLARDLNKRMRRGQLERSAKGKFSLYMDFTVFLLDYLTDWASMVLNFLNRQLVPAFVQGAIILIPVLLDCYKGKIQVVEAFGGFARSHRKGYPTNAFIKALRSEKSVEAPCRYAYSIIRCYA